MDKETYRKNNISRDKLLITVKCSRNHLKGQKEIVCDLIKEKKT